jgi:hypothetical protein
MKKTYYHAVTMDKIKSIMTTGLIKNVSENGIYFTDDAISSLNWIKCREQLWFKNNHKSIGLVIFEIDTDDDNYFVYSDNVTTKHSSYPKEWIEAQNAECIIYQKSIHPSLLKFEECIIDGDEYDCVELINNQKYSAPTKNMRIDLMLERLKHMCCYNEETGEYFVVPKGTYLQIGNDRAKARKVYDAYTNYWKLRPKQTKPFGETMSISL